MISRQFSVRAVENTITEAEDARFIISSNLATTTDFDVNYKYHSSWCIMEGEAMTIIAIKQ